MSEIIKGEVLSDINKANTLIVEKSGGKLILDVLTKNVVNGARNCIKDANSTDSVDERIKILVKGLQEIVTYVEQEADKTNNELVLLNNRVFVLKEVVEKFDKLNSDEKKMDEAEQQKK